MLAMRGFCERSVRRTAIVPAFHGLRACLTRGQGPQSTAKAPSSTESPQATADPSFFAISTSGLYCASFSSQSAVYWAGSKYRSVSPRVSMFFLNSSSSITLLTELAKMFTYSLGFQTPRVRSVLRNDRMSMPRASRPRGCIRLDGGNWATPTQGTMGSASPAPSDSSDLRSDTPPPAWQCASVRE